MQLLPLVEFSFNLSLAKMLFPPAIEDILKIIYIKPLYIIFYFKALKFLELSSEFPLTGPSSFICVFLNSESCLLMASFKTSKNYSFLYFELHYILLLQWYNGGVDFLGGMTGYLEFL